jgi:cell wall assembly regulator SMI1
MLAAYLKRIDRVLSVKAPDVFAGLRRGVGEEELLVLQQTCLRGQPIPEDLAVFFRWHNGQTGFASLSPLDNRMLMSLEDSVDTWKFMSEPDADIQLPWLNDWLPILANGGGDHIVYVASGPDRGKLVAYWHDSEDRRVAFESFEVWARKVLEACERESV